MEGEKGGKDLYTILLTRDKNNKRREARWSRGVVGLGVSWNCVCPFALRCLRSVSVSP